MLSKERERSTYAYIIQIVQNRAKLQHPSVGTRRPSKAQHCVSHKGRNRLCMHNKTPEPSICFKPFTFSMCLPTFDSGTVQRLFFKKGTSDFIKSSASSSGRVLAHNDFIPGLVEQKAFESEIQTRMLLLA